MVEKILNNTTPYGKIRASHEGLLHSSTLNNISSKTGLDSRLNAYGKSSPVLVGLVLVKDVTRAIFINIYILNVTCILVWFYERLKCTIVVYIIYILHKYH